MGLLIELKTHSILIWDNATIHKSPRLKDIIEKAGHEIIFLSPYSPDLNPIEHKWHEIKHNLAKYYNDKIDFTDNLIREVLRLTKWEVG